MRIWIDIVTPSQVHLFKALIPELRKRISCITTTRFAETTQLLHNFGIKSDIIGSHPTRKDLYKYLKVMERLILLTIRIKNFDISLSFQNFYVPLVTKIRNKRNITLFDNDLPSFDVNLMLKFSDYLICPNAISTHKLSTAKTKIYQFDGYKEDIYLADYAPDPVFMDQIPFKNYVVVRPEALFSIYVKEKKTIVPQLLSSMIRKGSFNVIYLPRSSKDLKYVTNTDIHIPKKPLNGLDLCWYSEAVLTGSGTFAREAARMGVPAVSFFPGRLLSVDRQLVKEGRIFHSRDVDEIIAYVHKHKNNRNPDYKTRSKKVKREVVNLINQILDSEISYNTLDIDRVSSYFNLRGHKVSTK